MGRLTTAYGDSDGPRLAELAASQHGVVSTEQLIWLGYSPNAIARLVAKGHLHRVHRGVYAVGYERLSLRGRWMAAVLACGPGAVLSHRSGAALWDIRPIPAGPIDVTAPRSRTGDSGVRVHRVRSLDPADVAAVDGIPVTTVARILLDLAETIPMARLRTTIDAADRRDLLDGRALEETLARNPGRRGTKPLRGALAAMTGPAPWTQSELENAFLVLIREAGLPEPQCNVLVHDELVDCYWPQVPLVVELDGYLYHKGRSRFEDDRRKSTKLQLAGIPVLQFTQPRLQFEPHAVLRDVSRALAQAA